MHFSCYQIATIRNDSLHKAASYFMYIICTRAPVHFSLRQRMTSRFVNLLLVAQTKKKTIQIQLSDNNGFWLSLITMQVMGWVSGDVDCKCQHFVTIGAVKRLRFLDQSIVVMTLHKSKWGSLFVEVFCFRFFYCRCCIWFGPVITVLCDSWWIIIAIIEINVM
jgi:hypothetical protein